ncbi:DUF2125 domain-containing protein [Methylobacterium sp. NEAU 140]|uniref:DUF2125 domain-containing protein n=1 Tax=Methylobacterium sp. NEAU 140 TaxID=3064945 RepID=UPI0027343981|nr:DUF2125 domain-containing protein [Methylobacterium sp. NEAU 140]MDP4022448.1 DUF2125 domain-containing protein [Methylobacterium sp. NEAU 140]
MTQDPTRRDARGTRASRRYGRLGLFLPYILLLVVAVLWSAGWFYIRGRAEREMDAWLAREAGAGRTWTCADRSVTGYPFRIELRCAAVTLERSDSRFRLGPITAAAQVYQPRLVLFEAQGPFHVEQGDLTGDATWTGLQGSFHGAETGFTRASLVIDGPKVTVAGAEPQPIAIAGRHLELHARPTPGRFDAEGAVDVSLQLAQAAIPDLDALTGTDTPADISLDATITRATVFGTGAVPRELERWREAGGSLDLTALSLAKGAQRVQAKGTITLDAAHRPAGQIDLRAAGVDALIGGIVGQSLGSDKGALVGQLVGGLLGLGSRRAEAGAPQPEGTPLKALPPLRLVDGRILFSGFPIPNVRLPALY